MDATQIIDLVGKYALPALIAFVVFLIGRMIANKVAVGVEVGLNRAPNSDPSLSRFFASLVKYVLLIAVIMVVLGILGIDTTPVIGLILASGTALAFVMQGALGNLAAGVMLMIFRPFKIGDEIEAGGTKGVVSAIELTATRLKTADNSAIIISNGKIWGGTIRNNNGFDARRLDLNIGVDYDASIDAAIKTITQAAQTNPRVHATPAPWAKVVNLGDSSVDIQLRVWCNHSDYKALSTEISQPIKQALDSAGIGIPYPHEVKIKQKVKSSKGRDRNARLKALREKKS
ncbi:MAG: mechanosensitive ion channel family protein [Maricaulaceae bacterium]